MTQTATNSTIAIVPQAVLYPAAVVTEEELKNILLARKGSAFVSFIARYDMSAKGKMNKGGRAGVPVNPWFGNLFKISESRGSVTFNYEEGVARRLEAEGKDASEHHKGETWHRPILNAQGGYTPLCCHKDDESRVYLRYRQDGIMSSRYEDKDGNPVEKSAVETWLPDKSGSYANQGLDNTLNMQTITLSNIVQLKLDHETYILKH